MNVYDFGTDEAHYRILIRRNRLEGYRDPVRPRGQSIADRWVAPVFEDCYEPDETGTAPATRPFGDFVSLEGLIGLGPGTAARTDGFLRNGAELLPVIYRLPDGRSEALLIHRIITMLDDAFDETRFIGRQSAGLCFPKRHAFHKEAIEDAVVFELPNVAGRFCTDCFKRHIEERGYTGLKFHLVWSEDPQGKRLIMDWERRVGYGDLPPMA